MFPHHASSSALPAEPLADAIHARQKRLGTADERTRDFAELCDLLHTWNNARAEQWLRGGEPHAAGALPREPASMAAPSEPKPIAGPEHAA